MTILKKLNSVEKLNVDSNMLLIYLARIMEEASEGRFDDISDIVCQLTNKELVRNDIIVTQLHFNTVKSLMEVLPEEKRTGLIALLRNTILKSGGQE